MMTKENTVFCQRLNEELPALKKAPLMGSLGTLIKENVSAQAWEEWLEIQMKIINEERLDLSEESAQEHLFEKMVNFLHLEDLVRI